MLSVVIPAHNEAENLPGLLEEIIEAFKDGRTEYEVVVVNDGSSDETAGVLTAIQQTMPQLRVVTHEKSCGQSTGLMSGVDASQGELIATLDGDGQNDPADIPRMLETYQTGTIPLTMVVGHRQKRKDGGWRLFCSKVANSVRSRMLKDATPDSGCGIKLFPKDAFQKFPRFDHMHRFLPALMRRLGGRVISQTVNHRVRGSGSSHYGTLGRLTAGVVDLVGVAWLMHRSRLPVLTDQKKESSGP
ncbi:MAG: glycosyltransferase family 2 protein [Planctomycetaceae bacterium]